MKTNKRNIIIVIILVFSISLLFIQINREKDSSSNFNKTTTGEFQLGEDNLFNKNNLSNEDFEIINISWNKYNTQFIINPEGGYSPSELKYSPIDWEHYCKNCGKTEGVNCTQSAYLIYTNQTKDLNCIIYYNGFQKTDYPEDIRWLFRKGIDVVGIGLESLDIKRDNEIKICCISENSNEVCKEIILKKAC